MPQPYLAYVRRFDVVPQICEDTGRLEVKREGGTGMFVLKRAERDGGQYMGDVILLEQILVEIAPKFREWTNEWTQYNSLAKSSRFYLNHFCDPEIFYRFEL